LKNKSKCKKEVVRYIIIFIKNPFHIPMSIVRNKTTYLNQACTLTASCQHDVSRW